MEVTRSAYPFGKIAFIGGLTLALLGLFVLTGWLLELGWIVSIVSGFPPMAMNTSICFLLSGIGLSASVIQRRRAFFLTQICLGLSVLLAVSRLVDIFLFGIAQHYVDLLLPRLLVDHAFLERYGAGVGPNVAMAFVSSGVPLMIASWRRDSIGRITLEISGYVVLTQALVAFTSRLTDAELYYSWGRYAGMAAHTSVGVILLGALMVVRARAMDRDRRSFPLWLPAIICMASFLFDLYTPLGIVNGQLYVPVVLIALWFGNPRTPFHFAMLSSGLIVVGFFALRHASANASADIANRLVTIATLWLVALFVSHFLRNSDKLREERVRFSALLNATPDAVISMDEKGIVLGFNPAAERMFGFEAAEAIGSNIRMLMPEPYYSEHDGYLQHYAETGEERIIGTARLVSGRRKGGASFPLDLSVSVLSTGNRKTFVGILRDATDRIRQQERLQTTLAKLEEYTAELERSNHDLDEFAYIASHDLKEPLRGLHNHSRFLLEDYEETLDTDGVRRLNRLVQLSQRMEKLVNDLLYFSRIGRQQLAVRRNDVGAIVRDVIETMELYLEDRHATVTIDTSMPKVVCDATRLTEVFRNLLTNAVKYNDKPRPMINIGCLDRCTGRDGKERSQVFYVRDNGKGIAETFYEDIFRIFKRLEKAQETDEGTGSGLTFVRKIIARHQGEIWLDSSVGEGTTFYFTLGKKGEASNAAS